MAATPRPTLTLDQIEAVVTKAVVAAASRDREQVIILTENIKTITEIVTDLDHTVNGNGKEGLDKRVDRLEQARQNSIWRKTGEEVIRWIVIAGLAAFFVLLVTHGIPLK